MQTVESIACSGPIVFGDEQSGTLFQQHADGVKVYMLMADPVEIESEKGFYFQRPAYDQVHIYSGQKFDQSFHPQNWLMFLNDDFVSGY